MARGYQAWTFSRMRNRLSGPSGKIVREPQQLDGFLVFRIFRQRFLKRLNRLDVVAFLVVGSAQFTVQALEPGIAGRHGL